MHRLTLRILGQNVRFRVDAVNMYPDGKMLVRIGQCHELLNSSLFVALDTISFTPVKPQGKQPVRKTRRQAAA